MGGKYFLFAISLIWLFFISVFEATRDYIITPRWFYDKLKLNWVGAWLFFIILRILSPIGTAIWIITGIFFGIKWLLTVGRKDE